MFFFVIILLHSWQIPDAKLGEDRVDGVVVDEESMRSECGAKILYGDNALEEFLYQKRNPENEMVCICYVTVQRIHNCNFCFQEENGYSYIPIVWEN